MRRDDAGVHSILSRFQQEFCEFCEWIPKPRGWRGQAVQSCRLYRIAGGFLWLSAEAQRAGLRQPRASDHRERRPGFARSGLRQPQRGAL